MTTTTAQTHCSQCDEEKDIYECKGCSQIFCFNHLPEHREGINQQFNQMEDQSNSLRQTILDQKDDSNKHFLIEEINQWEKESIQKIEQTAHECRERLIRYTKKFLIETENQLNELTEQLKQIRQKNKFNEIDLDQFNQKLTKLEAELHHPPNITIRQQQSTSLINNITLIIPLNKEPAQRMSTPVVHIDKASIFHGHKTVTSFIPSISIMTNNHEQSNMMDFTKGINENLVIFRLKRKEQFLVNNGSFDEIDQFYLKCVTHALELQMTNDKYCVELLSSESTVEQRAAVIKRFRGGTFHGLVITNVYAFGIDIDDIL